VRRGRVCHGGGGEMHCVDRIEGREILGRKGGLGREECLKLEERTDRAF